MPVSQLEVLSLHAQGGMAEVFRARGTDDQGRRRDFAVKKVIAQYARDQAVLNMFIEEARIAACLNHPNIVGVHDLVRAPSGELYIVMDFVDGRDLADLIHAANTIKAVLPPSFGARIAVEVLEALDYAFNATDSQDRALALIHRDLSPHNVMLNRQGDVLLTDFGIAKVNSASNQTQHGIIKGKFGYMSPEQARARPLDARSDIFNVGILLYELWTSERLFAADTDVLTLDMMRLAHVPPLPSRRRVPAALEAFMRRCLAREPSGRPPSAQQASRELRAVMAAANLVGSHEEAASILHQLLPPLRVSAPVAAPAVGALKSQMFMAGAPPVPKAKAPAPGVRQGGGAMPLSMLAEAAPVPDASGIVARRGAVPLDEPLGRERARAVVVPPVAVAEPVPTDPPTAPLPPPPPPQLQPKLAPLPLPRRQTPLAAPAPPSSPSPSPPPPPPAPAAVVAEPARRQAPAAMLRPAPPRAYPPPAHVEPMLVEAAPAWPDTPRPPPPPPIFERPMTPQTDPKPKVMGGESWEEEVVVRASSPSPSPPPIMAAPVQAPAQRKSRRSLWFADVTKQWLTRAVAAAAAIGLVIGGGIGWVLPASSLQSVEGRWVDSWPAATVSANGVRLGSTPLWQPGPPQSLSFAATGIPTWTVAPNAADPMVVARAAGENTDVPITSSPSGARVMRTDVSPAVSLGTTPCKIPMENAIRIELQKQGHETVVRSPMSMHRDGIHVVLAPISGVKLTLSTWPARPTMFDGAPLMAGSSRLVVRGRHQVLLPGALKATAIDLDGTTNLLLDVSAADVPR